MSKNRENRKFVYLISPNQIKSKDFFINLNLVLKTKKVSFFQLRLKKETTKKRISIGKRVRKICKKNKVKFLINDDPYLAKKLNADGCHLGQKDISILKARKILKNKIILEKHNLHLIKFLRMLINQKVPDL